ncbi:MAG: nucleotidyltransferase family protein [Chloroflexi bacterium]|nr:nucleotidyltransferase family protein [Chloroflexota bacterium]
MKTLAEIRRILEIQKPYLAKRYGIVEVGVFGSYVRREQTSASDIDVLIGLERPPKISLIDLVELEDYLSQLLNTKVDIAIKSNLKRRIGQHIMQEAVPI